MGRLSGIRLRNYKREKSKNKSKQEVIMEESSKEGTRPGKQAVTTVHFGHGHKLVIVACSSPGAIKNPPCALNCRESGSYVEVGSVA
ncbi:hypothetical protein TNCV_2120421 [Trichonephila clavipes]|nr:hypothetical protein TNCV_2120421 [Trichonephila clavipes]